MPSLAKKVSKKAPKAITLQRDVAVVSQLAQSRAQVLLDLILRRKARIAEDFYDIGEALRELKNKKLFGSLGHTSFGEMLDKRKIMSRAQANKLIDVVTALPRNKALALGPEKAYALTRFAAATPSVDNAATLLATGVVTKSGRVKAVTDATVQELTLAARDARALAPSRKLNPEQRDAEKVARAAQAEFRRKGAKGATVVVFKKRAGGYHARLELPIEVLRFLM